MFKSNIKRTSVFMLIVVMAFVFDLSVSTAQTVYQPRQDAISNALDRAEKSMTLKDLSGFQQEVVVNKAMEEMPFRPTGTPARTFSPRPDKTAETPASFQSVEPVVSEIPVENILKKKESQPSAQVALAANPLPADLKASDFPKEKETDSLRYRYLDLANPQNEFEMGTEAFDYSYREEGFMKLDGMMYGVFMNYQHRFHENPDLTKLGDIMRTNGVMNVARVDARFASGNEIKYRSRSTGEHDDEDHYAFETRLTGGYEFPVKKHGLLFMPYAGMGYRYLKDDNGGSRTTTGAWNYDRESHYYYVPLGLEASKFFHGGWKIKWTLEYDWFLGGRQYTHLEDVPTYSETLINDQTSGYGVRSSWRLAKEGEFLEFFVEPFVRYWHIDDSKPASTSETAGLEPNNRTEEYGARMGVRF